MAAGLRDTGSPRLLLVAPDAAAPEALHWDEDWVRLPARDDDVRARTAALQARAAARAPRPEVTGDGRLSYAGRWVQLSPIEEPMARLLADRFGDVVDAGSLAACAAGRRLSATAVRVHITRLRKRVKTMELSIRVVRGHGYVLDADPSEPVPE